MPNSFQLPLSQPFHLRSNINGYWLLTNDARLTGAFVGTALTHGIPINVFFKPSFYTILMGAYRGALQLKLDDLALDDKLIHDNLKSILEYVNAWFQNLLFMG